MDDDTSSDLEGLDPDHVEALSARPRFHIKVRSDGTLFGVFDQTGVTSHEDTPPTAHGLVDVVDLEGHDTGDLGHHGIGGPKDHSSIREHEIHREGNRA
jgi:hypothetical protein